MKPVIAAVFILHLVGSIAGAQAINPRIAVPGPGGIFIEAGNRIPSTASGLTGFAGYRIERKEEAGGQWREVAILRSPAIEEEFSRRLERSTGSVPVPFSADQLPVGKIWGRAEKYHRLDSLGVWGGLLAVRLALGLAYYDTSARRGVAYQYRVGSVDQSGKSGGGALSGVVSYPSTAKLAEMRCVQRFGSETAVSLRWQMGIGRRPGFVEVYRQTGFAGDFVKIPAVVRVSLERNTASFLVRDTLVTPLEIYRYHLKPFDSYGNAGEPSDTALAAAIDFSRVPPPRDLHAVSIDSAGAIAVRWVMPDPGYLKSVRIYRSAVWDSAYVQIGEVAPAAGQYVDQVVEPMKEYFYRIRWIGMLGEESVPSPRVRCEYRERFPPPPPAGVVAEPDAKGVRVRWAHEDPSVNGYYVYRSGAAADTFEQVSPLIPARGQECVFLDTSGVVGTLTYAYLVRAENASHLLGPESDTVYVRPGFSLVPKRPAGLRAAVVEGAAQLTWEDVYRQDPTVQGVIVLRREASSSGKPREFAALSGMPLPPGQNHVADTTLQPGVAYEYAVVSVGLTGERSGQSDIVSVVTVVRGPLPPAGVRASRHPNGVSVEWDESADVDLAGYRVYRYERGATPKKVADVRSDVQTFLDAQPARGRLYFYYVTSVDRSRKESSGSSEVGIRR